MSKVVPNEKILLDLLFILKIFQFLVIVFFTIAKYLLSYGKSIRIRRFLQQVPSFDVIQFLLIELSISFVLDTLPSNLFGRFPQLLLNSSSVEHISLKLKFCTTGTDLKFCQIFSNDFEILLQSSLVFLVPCPFLCCLYWNECYAVFVIVRVQYNIKPSKSSNRRVLCLRTHQSC